MDVEFFPNLQPFSMIVFFYVDGGKYGIGTDTVCAVWVGQITGYINLMRLNVTKKFQYDIDIGFTDRVLLNLAGLIEWKVKEMATA